MPPTAETDARMGSPALSEQPALQPFRGLLGRPFAPVRFAERQGWPRLPPSGASDARTGQTCLQWLEGVRQR